MASILKVDELQGITAAGDITITSEGGAATQSLQQGLAKAWGQFNGRDATIAYSDSFNCASLTDNGTSDYTTTRTNNMGNADYSAFGTAGRLSTSERNFNINDEGLPNTTSAVRIQITTSDGAISSDQAAYVAFGILGDLA